MERVSPDLIKKHIRRSPLLASAYRLLERDREVQALLKMTNIMAVTRLKYNDHGVVHSRIVSGAALELFDIFISRGIKPTSIRDHVVNEEEEAKLIVLFGAYLHDIGNAVHRIGHHIHGYNLAIPILNRLLPQVIDEKDRFINMRQEILHVIYSHDEHVRCLTTEAGIVKIADGTDMAEGRARIPYQLGKVDMHSLSALAIDSVEIGQGDEKPVCIRIYMRDTAGLFQIEEVFMKKAETSGLRELIEIEAYVKNRRLTVSRG
ncbi:MAG: HD domain-containing protein [Thermoprotei archaeon]|nr:HD domain-containing protein [Thermoprotei archaeon]